MAFFRPAFITQVYCSIFTQVYHATLMTKIELPVPYFSQRDSATWQGSRMCFSSTCAMAAEFLKPKCLSGPGQRDDRYLSLVERFGDTTSSQAQVEALKSLGIKAVFRTDGTIEGIVKQLTRGIPVPCGWLHLGHISAPSGGGHWSLVVGWIPETLQLIVHDPFGEADLRNGGYVTTAIGSGQAQRYSRKNWGRRWMNEGTGSGWWLELSK